MPSHIAELDAYSTDPYSAAVRSLTDEISTKASVDIGFSETFDGGRHRYHAFTGDWDDDEGIYPDACGSGRNYVSALNMLAEELGVTLERDSIENVTEGEAA